MDAPFLLSLSQFLRSPKQFSIFWTRFSFTTSTILETLSGNSTRRNITGCRLCTIIVPDFSPILSASTIDSTEKETSRLCSSPLYRCLDNHWFLRNAPTIVLQHLLKLHTDRLLRTHVPRTREHLLIAAGMVYDDWQWRVLVNNTVNNDKYYFDARSLYPLNKVFVARANRERFSRNRYSISPVRLLYPISRFSRHDAKKCSLTKWDSISILPDSRTECGGSPEKQLTSSRLGHIDWKQRAPKEG